LNETQLLEAVHETQNARAAKAEAMVPASAFLIVSNLAQTRNRVSVIICSSEVVDGATTANS
jgi:hypothetical protein